MYESIQGKLVEKSPSKAIVETYGIAYRLLIPLSTYSKLPALETNVLLYLTQIVREDAHTLYAFSSKEERDLFETIITVSGIGPKTGIGIIGHVETDAFQRAITTGDVRLLSQLPGIGKKTAERLVIEMRDKFKGGKTSAKTPLSAAPSLLGDAMNALINLGYTPLKAQEASQKALQQMPGEEDLGKIITSALKNLN